MGPSSNVGSSTRCLSTFFFGSWNQQILIGFFVLLKKDEFFGVFNVSWLTFVQEYANFALFSSNATAVDLCLFKEADLIDGQITHRIPLSPEMNKTGSVWHIGLVDLDPGLLYGYSVHGPNGYNLDDGEEVPPQIAGHAFQSQRVVLDPRATAVFNGRKKYGELGPDLNYNSDGVLGYSRTWPQAAAAVPSSSRTEFDWEGDRPLGRPMEDLVIYEAHVRGFTADSSSQSDHPGNLESICAQQLEFLG